jgi:hypothetical protein
MQLLTLIFFFLLSSAFAEVGNVKKVLGGEDGYALRGSERIKLEVNLPIELGDEIFSQNSVVLLQIDPSTQVSMAKNSQLKLSEHQVQELSQLEKAFSVVEFISGLIRVNLVKDQDQEIEQQIKTRDVVFGVRGTDFEVAIEESGDVDLDVFEGEVAVSSPYIHSFVPEIVKGNEGFRFQKSKKAFLRRKFMSRFKNHPGFERPDLMRKAWKEKKIRRNKMKDRQVEKKRSRKDRSRSR